MADINSIRFEANRPLLKEVSADRLNSMLSEIRKNRPKGERGITVRQTGDGTYIGLAASTGAGSAAAQADHPFKVLVRQFEPEGPFYWGVVNDSKLFISIFDSNPQSTFQSGRLGPNADEEDAAWFEIQPPDYIYIEYDAEAGTAKIDTVGNGGSFDPDAAVNEAGGLIEISEEETPYTFKFARKIIATAEEPQNSGESPVVKQGITQHQILQDIVLSGSVSSYFFDYSGIGKIQES